MIPRLVESSIGRLENSDRLERLGDAVRPGLSRAIGAGRRLDALTGRRLGHPLHPAAVLLPTSTWIAAAILDASGDRRLRPAAQRLVAIGTAAASASTPGRSWPGRPTGHPSTSRRNRGRAPLSQLRSAMSH